MSRLVPRRSAPRDQGSHTPEIWGPGLPRRILHLILDPWTAADMCLDGPNWDSQDLVTIQLLDPDPSLASGDGHAGELRGVLLEHRTLTS